ncbi:FixH family protein [Noviherbaspirillum pedocola]|uniref:FixH family protein n=1 Tax=Noviherbaspirillum pedocola TaxID=2801341 RepID=A0A934SN60_9BURK|nr:FixH family protein [Noviherbaspirillum pedocola]MBK4733621.1 FixH family protein [Noviherbaspirillum pedocola]
MQVANLSPSSSAAPWYRHAWPWLLMLGPFLVILAGGYTSWLAFSRQDALVVGDYYLKGKAINQDLRRERTAATLGLSLALSYDAASGRLSGRVAGSTPVRGAMTLRLIHPTRPDRDLTLPVQPDANGAFALTLPMLDMARWQVLLEDGALAWRLEGDWSWPQQRDVRIAAQH